ncbi:hypothetical protein LTR04_001409 [Oleoguttula sp. CCFEE 6159]|nr:hypothetical protein LTR04_001409 [Oleoguttula sp. CCFEE 6159]
MSSASNDAPQTPNSKASSGLLGAFRNFTHNRQKVIPSPSPSSAANVTPVLASFLRQRSNAGLKTVSEVGNGVSGSYDNAGDWLENYNDDFREGEVTGGPPELHGLVLQLGCGPLTDRMTAAQQICSILEEYSVSNIIVIINAARHLIDERDAEASQAGFGLLTSCAKYVELTSRERSIFFQTILTMEDQANMRLRFQLLKDLTKNGRNIETLERVVVPLLGHLLCQVFEATQVAHSKWKREHKVKKYGAEEKPKTETPKNPALRDGHLFDEKDLSMLFRYTSDIIKFNSKIFGEADLDLLLNRVLHVCKKTRSEPDIESSVEIIDTLITYADIPAGTLKPCVEILCGIFCQVSKSRDQTWKTIENLLKSHLGQSTITALLEVLMECTEQTPPNTLGVIRGVVSVLYEIVDRNRQGGLPKVPISYLMQALNRASVVSNASLRRKILRLLLLVFEDSTLTELFLGDGDWLDLLHVLEACAPQILNTGKATKAAAKKSPEQTTNLAHTTSQDDASPKTLFELLIDRLDALSHTTYAFHRRSLMDLFIRLTSHLTDSAVEGLVKFFAEERLLYPSNENWIIECERIINGILRDPRRPRALRVLVINVLNDAYNVIECLTDTETVNKFAMIIFENIDKEFDHAVFEVLSDFAISVADGCSDALFDDMVDVLRAQIFNQTILSPTSLPHYVPKCLPVVQPSSASIQQTESIANLASKALVRMFVRGLNKSAAKSQRIFHVLLDIVGSSAVETDARMTALKLLFRLRSDINHAVFVLPSMESEGLAASLYRTAQTANLSQELEEAADNRGGFAEEESSAPPNRTTSGISPHSSMSRSNTRSTSGVARTTRAMPPLWMYGRIQALPEEPSTIASHLLHSCQEPGLAGRAVLDMASWLDLVLSILQRGADWEVYSYTLVHLGAQITNQSLFTSAIKQIRLLRSTVCEQIRGSKFFEPPAFTGLRKANVATCLFHVLTMLVSYHAHLKKEQEDEMMRTFLSGIGSWEGTSNCCIHALSICCHELPLSVSKSLDIILTKMTQIITQAQVAVHILEFLAGLSRCSDLYKNFRDDDYRMVFGICFRYLQYARDQRNKASDQPASRTSQASSDLRHSGTSTRDFTQASDPKSKPNSASDDLPQYVYALAFHVITFWFLSLKLHDRSRQIPWITKNLVYTDNAGQEVVEDQALVTIDMMHRVAYSDRDETGPDPDFAKPADGTILKKTWLVGLSLMTVETAARTGSSQVTRRRPSGTRYSIFRPELISPPRHQTSLTTGLAADAFYTESYVGVLPDALFQDFYSPMYLTPGTSASEQPIPLPDDDATTRALSAFDRNDTLDSHKVGIIYIGERQTLESEILSNVTGSADYDSFVAGLGTLVKLKGAKFNLHGLDRNDGADGEYTYCWRDRVTEIIFHITTMMPTNLEYDAPCIQKKRHIGNDFVNIIFNNSGLPFSFDTFPSDFNYVYIVITPEARATFVETRARARQDGQDQFYKVQVLSKAGFPSISAAAEAKIISGRSLAAYVRLLALNASVFSLVWAARDSGEYISSWRARLREIKKLREKHAHADADATATAITQPMPAALDGLRGTISSPPGTRDSAALRRTSATALSSEGTNRSSVITTASETERTESSDSRD